MALEDFNNLIEMDFMAPKPYFYKAKALERLGEHDDAVLCFEQVLKLSEDDYLHGNSLYEITKIRVRQRDFYEAYYFLQRSNKTKLKLPKLALYNSFTEAVILLMKRKTKKGIGILTQLIECKPLPLSNEIFLNPLVYTYRAYGRIILQEYDAALKDLLKASSLKKLPASAHYNLQL